MLRKIILIAIIIAFNNGIILTSELQSEQSKILSPQDFFIEAVTICSNTLKANTQVPAFDFSAIIPINTYIAETIEANKSVSFNGLLEYFICHEHTNMALKLISSKNINISSNIMSDGNSPLAFCVLHNLNKSLKMISSLSSCDGNSKNE